MRFHKYHGLGNDFIVVDLRASEGSPSPLDPETAKRLCDRRFGVGADGVIGLLPPAEAENDARMRIINADGSEAEMCGNGIRCLAKFLYEQVGVGRRVVRIETLAGLRACSLTLGPDGTVESVAVEMGAPELEHGRIPMKGEGRFVDGWLEVAGQTLKVTAVSMGNPHAVTFVDEEPLPLAESLGPHVEVHPAFPRRTNAEFARVAPDGAIDLAVWERGCGITLACGTGACATAVAAVLTGRVPEGREVEIRLPGGTLHVTVVKGLGGVTMRGPATLVFTGTFQLS
ncbi:MAG: diaminopimelate epimerase [Deltaproteobacteria bacterium]|nr:diaminopimelate epimerase [Deltaproteobacteria bacterium]